MRKRTFVAGFFALVTCLASTRAWSAPVEYRAEFYSYIGFFGRASTSHTFARFTKIENGVATEVVDISWLPAPGYFRSGNRVPFFRQVPGHNYSLERTKAIAGNKPIIHNGTFDITPEMYEAAVRRKGELERGRYDYKMIDGSSADRALNCIHALSGVVAFLPTGLSRGPRATDKVVDFFLATRHMRPRGALWPAYGAPRVGNVQASPSPAVASHGSPAPAGRPGASPRFYSADTSAPFAPLAPNTVAVAGTPVPRGAIGWRLGASGEVIWVYRSESEIPR